MRQEGAAGIGELDPTRPAKEERRADLDLQIAKLPAKGRLGRVQPLLGSDGDATFLGHGNKIAEMSELHIRPMPDRYRFRSYKVFLPATTKT